MINNDIDSHSAIGMVRIIRRYFSVTSFTCTVTLWPMASLGLVSPGVATDGCNPIFS